MSPQNIGREWLAVQALDDGCAQAHEPPSDVPAPKQGAPSASPDASDLGGSLSSEQPIPAHSKARSVRPWSTWSQYKAASTDNKRQEISGPEDGTPPNTNRGGVLDKPPEISSDLGFVKNAATVGYKQQTDAIKSAAFIWTHPEGTSSFDAIDTGEELPFKDVGYYYRPRFDGLLAGYYYKPESDCNVTFMKLGEVRDELAKRVKAGFGARHVVEIAGHPFELYPHGGAGGYALLLRCDDLGLEIRADCSRPTNPEVKIRFAGRYFYRQTLGECIDTAEAVAAHFGDVQRSLVSEIQVCCDVPVDPNFLHLSERLRGHGRRGFHILTDAVTGEHSTLANYGGSKAVQVVIYKKHLERSAVWLAYIERLGLNPATEKTLRVEIRPKRKYLKQHGIDTVRDVSNTASVLRIWRHVLTDYIWISADSSVEKKGRATVPLWYDKLVRLGSEYARIPDYTQSVDITTHRLNSGVGSLASEYRESGLQHLGVHYSAFLADCEEAAQESAEADIIALLEKHLEQFRTDIPRIAAAAVAGRAKELREILESHFVRFESSKAKYRKYTYTPKIKER